MRPAKARPCGRCLESSALGLFAGLGLISLLAGCTAKQYHEQADKEVYKIIRQGQKVALGETNAFTIDTRYSSRNPQEVKAGEIIEERVQKEKRVLTMEEALRLATEHSRTYQTRREQLYLSAMALTSERFRFALQPSVTSDAALSKNATREDGTLGSRIGLDKLMMTGGRVSATLANDILRFYSRGGVGTLASSLSVSLSQPLLRGGGAAIVGENLTQAERNVIYEIRSFSQFQRSFNVSIISTYYRILQQKDVVRNNYDNYTRVASSAERAKAQAQASRVSISQAEQAKQNELRSRRSYISSLRSYQDTLDQFKVTLGIPVSLDIELDDGVLEELRKTGIAPIDMDPTDAYKLAVDHQPELVNEIDRFEDMQRKIRVAANALKAGLNLSAGTTFNAAGGVDYSKFDFSRTSADAGLELDLPLPSNRLPQRNTYRNAFINFERQIRNLSLALDNVRVDINEGLRAMNQFQREYKIQQEELALANRRVAFETELFNAGRSEIRNLLEAQVAQINSANDISRTLVNFHVARLQYLVDLGILDIDLDRFWLHEKPVMAKLNLPDMKTSDTTDELTPPDQLFK